MSKRWLLQQAFGTCTVLSFFLILVSVGNMIELLVITSTLALCLIGGIVGLVLFGLLFALYD